MRDRDMRRMRETFALLWNIDFHDLADADLMPGVDDWRRYNDDPTKFALKLDDAGFARFAALIESRMPERLRQKEPEDA